MDTKIRSQHSTAFDITTTFITKIIFLGGNFIISILLARLLGPEGKGIITALFVIPNMMVSLADLGIRQAAAYYIGQKKYSIQDVLSSSMFLWIITSAISMIVVFAYYIFPMTETYSWVLIVIGVAYVPTKILVSYFNGILQGQQKIGNMNMKFLIDFVVRLILVIFLIWIFNLGVVGAALATFFTTFSVLFYSTNVLKKNLELKFKYIKGVPQDLFRKGIVFAIALFVLTLNYKIDIIFLENMVGATDLGYYSVGVSLAELIWQVPSAIGMVLFARSANSESDLEASNRSALLLRMCWPPLIIGSIIFWIGAPFLVETLYGQDFIEAGQVIRVLLPGIILMVLFKILNADLAGRGRPLFALKIYLVTLVINIGLNFWLIPEYGIYGAAFASSISYTVGAIIFSIAYHKHTGLSYHKLFIMDKEDFGLLTSVFDKWKNGKG